MDQKRAVASMGGRGGRGGVAEEERGEEGGWREVVGGWGEFKRVEEVSLLFCCSTGLTTSSNSRLTGSPIEVSLANFDNDRRSVA